MPKWVEDWETGVYCWLDTKNGKRYIGSAAESFRIRLARYKRDFAKDKCHNVHLQHIYNKDGIGRLQFLILERCHPDDCVKREQYWIDYHQSADGKYGYNLCPLAGSQKGYKHRPESVEKFKQSLTGKPKSEEHKAALSAARKGTKWSAKQRIAVIRARKLRPEAMGRYVVGEHNPRCKTSKDSVMMILQWPNSYDGSLQELARSLNVKNPSVQAIRSGRIWSHLYKYHSKFVLLAEYARRKRTGTL